MKHQLIRLTISTLASFHALSAIGGGTALLLDTYQDGALIEAGGKARFPLEWLRDTPSSDYTVPALILTVGVGGSSLVALVLLMMAALGWAFLPTRSRSASRKVVSRRNQISICAGSHGFFQTAPCPRSWSGSPSSRTH